MILSSLMTVLKKRENNARRWILILVGIFCLNKVATYGAMICEFMFLRLQYKITTVNFGNLKTVYFLSSAATQLTIVPLLVKKFKLNDTTILLLAFLSAIPGWAMESFLDQTWFLFFTRLICYPLWANLFSTARSVFSKLMNPNEVAKSFSVLAVSEACLALIFKPLYGILYRETVEIFPGTWNLVAASILLIACGLTIFVHFGSKSDGIQASVDAEDNNQQNMEEKTLM